MENRKTEQVGRSSQQQKTDRNDRRAPKRKMSEYGKQLYEKQRVKRMYGMRERQFRRFFDIAVHTEGAPGENLLSLLERRLDNTVYRLKMATSRIQARQMVIHGHVYVNGKKVHSASYFVSPNDVITLSDRVLKKPVFIEQVVDKRMKMGIKVPEWLELNKQDHKGIVVRTPIRADIKVPIEEHLIVELYSK